MKISEKEKAHIRELAKRYAELAALPIQEERRTRARDINDLKPRRPIVWLDEIPWHEMDIDGNLRPACQNPAAVEIEQYFLTILYRWKYIQADMVIENFYPVYKHCEISDIGLSIQEDVLATDAENNIISHSFIDQLDSMEKVAALKLPIVKADPMIDSQRLEFVNDIIGDILPARLRGHMIYHAPWDRIPRFRGVTTMLTDLIAEPQLMHATIRKFTDYGHSGMKQMKELGLLEHDLHDLHCTPGYVSETEGVWFRGMAQIFTEVSREMWEEFDLEYMKPLMAECGLVYYGCCEALDNKIPALKAIPNMRKIGVSPWANAESCAEQIGKDYVYAHKPNPAYVSKDFDEAAVRAEISRIIKCCQANGCPYEFVLKDISTVSYKPKNLMDWTRVVKETIDKYYN